MCAQRFVQVHDSFDRSVEPSEEFARHDEEAERVMRVPKALLDGILRAAVASKLLPIVWVRVVLSGVDGHDHSRFLAVTEKSGDRFPILDAQGSIVSNDLSL